MLKIIFCSLTFMLIISTFKLSAGETISIDKFMYQVGNSHNLIIVNEDVSKINQQWKGTKSGILLDKHYDFISPIQEVKIGKKYLVKNSSGIEYTLYFSSLPIIRITSPSRIVDEPRVMGEFTMSENSGNILYSYIGVEYRGGASQEWEKKSFRLEFLLDTNIQITRDVSLLGMRDDDDWNLQAMFNEPLRIRNRSCFEIWDNIYTLPYKEEEPDAVAGIKMKYSDLFLNNEYLGIFAVGERIDRKQLKLKKYKDGSIRGELYKGAYWDEATVYKSAPDYDNEDEFWSGYRYEYPKEEVDWKSFHAFIDFAINSDIPTFYEQYKDIFDINNAVDYFIFINLLTAFDNTGKNIYVARYDQNSTYFYLPWDMDGCFGTDWEGKIINNTTGKVYNTFYRRLVRDCENNGFNEKLKTRWNYLKQNVITEQAIMKIFRKNHDILYNNGAYEREEIAYEVYEYDEDHLDFISTWTNTRLQFLDNFFNEECIPAGVEDNILTKDMKLYPNPAKRVLNFESIEYPGTIFIEIYDVLGNKVFNDISSGELRGIDLPNLSSGMYNLIIKYGKSLSTQKFIIE